MQNKKRVLLVGGGSGGHIIPNLTVATALKRRHPFVTILYVGSRQTMDRMLVTAAGIPFLSIYTGKLRRYFSWRNFVSPLLLLIGFFQSLRIMFTFRPHVVFSKGGFVSLPVVIAAFVTFRPVVLHESDARMGLANRIGSRFAKKICVAFPSAGSDRKNVVLTGNPTRTFIKHGDAWRGYKITGLQPEKPVLLVWGGSLGAKQINDLIENSLSQLTSTFQIIHITGRGKTTSLSDPNYVQFEYLHEDLASIYAIVDFVFGRAGANSLYELALLQKPNIILPLMQNRDQIKNAEYFEQKGASIVLRNNDDLVNTFMALYKNTRQQQLMKLALREIATPDAADKIATLILNLPSS